MNNNKIIKKSLKAYLKAKDAYNNSNYKKAEKYLIFLIENFKKIENLSEQYQDIIEETLNESINLLNKISLFIFEDSIEENQLDQKDNNLINLVNIGDYVTLKNLLEKTNC